MKKTLLTSLAVGVMSIGLIASNSSATSVTYKDTTIFFPGYGNSTIDDINDTIGTPKVASMTVNYDQANLLQSVALDITGRRVYDTLFIDANGDKLWDYIVRDKSGGMQGGGFGWPGSTLLEGLYTVAQGYQYTLVPSLETTDRENHPNGIEDRFLTKTNFDMAKVVYDNVNLLTYDLSSMKIALDPNFTFAYAPWCANDVIITSPVPEPATMLLFGAGIAGLAGIARRRKTTN